MSAVKAAPSSSSLSSDLSLSSIPVDSFTYVAEGGANLVVAHTGQQQQQHDRIHSVLTGTVLRLRKRAHGAPTLSATTLQEEDASVAFTDSVVVPLLPSHSTPRLISVPIHDEAWLEALSRHIEPSRPSARRAVDAVDPERGYVVLADNLVGTAKDKSLQLSIEIKPKWGFLPNPSYLSEDSKPIKTSHCRFCLHRLHKAHSGISAASASNPEAASHGHIHAQHTNKDEYCPLDLYSGDRSRVVKALHALVKGWKDSNGKGNNLKVFYEGEMVRPSDNIRFLGHDAQDQQDTTQSEDSLPDLLADFITTSPLVRRLSHLQSSLDPLDIEGLAKIVAEKDGLDLFHAKEEALLHALGGEVSLMEYTNFVKEYCAADADAGTAAFLNASSDARSLIISYLLSAAFKDCSMFITVREDLSTPIGEGDGGKNQGQRKTASSADRQLAAYLVDVDVKSIKRLGRYAKLDSEIVQTYQRFEKDGGKLERCVA